MDPQGGSIGDIVAILDQAKAALAAVALMLADYRRQLIAGGVDPDDALELCLELQRAIIFVDLGRE